jgi:plasmid maintenance system antidote protein VapI
MHVPKRRGDNQLITRHRSVTAEMALRLARYFGTSAQVWQNLQAQYDMEVADAAIKRYLTRKIIARLRHDLNRSQERRDRKSGCETNLRKFPSSVMLS